MSNGEIIRSPERPLEGEILLGQLTPFLATAKFDEAYSPPRFSIIKNDFTGGRHVSVPNPDMRAAHEIIKKSASLSSYTPHPHSYEMGRGPHLFSTLPTDNSYTYDIDSGRWLLFEAVRGQNIYRPGHGGNVANVLAHSGNRHVLKLDISKAYDSVVHTRLATAMAATGETRDIDAWSWVIKKFVAEPNGNIGIAQGGPISPILFSAYMHSLDVRLTDYSNKNDFTYTRYADDIVMSSPDGNLIGRRRAWRIKQEIRDHGFDINPGKVRRYDLEESPAIITGLQLNKSGRVQLPTRSLRNIRNELRDILTQFETGQKVDAERYRSAQGLTSYFQSTRDSRREPLPRETEIQDLWSEIRKHRAAPNIQLLFNLTTKT